MDERVIGVDLYNHVLTGNIACNLNASSCNSPTHSGPSVLICLNEQGESVTDVSDKARRLRTQDHRHHPVVCFEPGIMSRDCNAGKKASIDICGTIRAEMGDNLPAVCYGVDPRNGALDEERTFTIQAKSGGGFSYNCTPSICYAIEGNCVGRNPKQNGSGIGKDISPSLNTIDRHAICYTIYNVLASGSGNAEITDGLISPTLLCRAGTGGNNVPIIVAERKNEGE